MKIWGKGLGADLSEESDWLLAHSMRITDVGFDDLSKWLLHSLQSKKHNIQDFLCVNTESICSLCRQEIMSLSSLVFTAAAH